MTSTRNRLIQANYINREVHKALHKNSKQLVALKRILMHNEKEGMPVTALREIKILKALRHPCIVELLDMFVMPSGSFTIDIL